MSGQERTHRIAHPTAAGFMVYLLAAGCFLLIGKLDPWGGRIDILGLASVGACLACLAGYLVGRGVLRRLARPGGILQGLLPHSLLTLAFAVTFLNPPFEVSSWERLYLSGLVLPGAILFLFSNSYLASRAIAPGGRDRRIRNRLLLILMTYGCLILGVWTGIATRGLSPFSTVVPPDRANDPILDTSWEYSYLKFTYPRNVEPDEVGKTVREVLDTKYPDRWYIDDGEIRIGPIPSPWEGTIPYEIVCALDYLVYDDDVQF